MKGHPVDVDALPEDIASGAGNRRDDRGVVAREPVQQTRLPRIGAAGDDYRHAFAQQASLSRALLDGIEMRAHAVEPLVQLTIREEIDLLFGEIDRGLDVG